MTATFAKSAISGAASLLAALLLAGTALADGLPSKGAVASPGVSIDGRPCTFSFNAGVTTDYVFRGISQSSEHAALLGGADVTCGRFYVGVAASGINWDWSEFATTEFDWYGGFRTKTGPISWDLGLIYYSYP